MNNTYNERAGPLFKDRARIEETRISYRLRKGDGGEARIDSDGDSRRDARILFSSSAFIIGATAPVYALLRRVCMRR